MTNEDVLRKLEGLHTVETAAAAAKLSRQSAINLLSKLKKEGYVTVSGGGKQPRLYKVTMRKQRPRDNGMFVIINKYSPMKLSPWYDHQVHGTYGPEEALVDALQTQSFRVILASMRLFNHITDWPKLYRLSKEKNVWQKVGAVHDTAMHVIRVRRMPKAYKAPTHAKKQFLIRDYLTKEPALLPVEDKWKVAIPFRKGDLERVVTG